MEYKSLKINSDKYNPKVFGRIKIIFDKMDVMVYDKEFAKAIAYGQDALERLKEEEDIAEIYPIISDAIAKVTLESMRVVK